MTAAEPDKIGGLLLAAGGSTRLGTPKQLLLYEGVSLIRRAGSALAASVCSPVIVVLGADIERSGAEIADLGLGVCVNSGWETGMSSSIRAGLNCLLEIEPDLAAVIIALCDQPLITSGHLNELAASFAENGSPIVAAGYGDTAGVPALFAREMFPGLLEISGDKGARQLIRSHPDLVKTISVPVAEFDIDTPDDLARMPAISFPPKK